VVLDKGMNVLDLTVDLPAPRNRVSPEFQSLRSQVLAALGVHQT
jgi:hypothetical protein